MTRKCHRIALLLCLGAAAMPLPGAGAAPGPRVIPLWPGAPPGKQTEPTEQTVVERGDANGLRDRYAIGITKPTLTVFTPAEPNGVGLLVVPGGGYQRVVMDKEGYESARWFAEHGVTAFVLLYRLPGEHWTDGPDVPLQDAERAMRLIRSVAPTYALDDRCIGVLGFSAGGHVAATLANRFDAAVYAPVDDLDRLSARPDFSVLMYPVISMQKGAAHPGSRTRLLGEHPSPAAEIAYSAHLNVTESTPPTFLLNAADDPAVPVENTLLMFAALRAAGVPAELHVFEEGGHGFGLRNSMDKPVAVWPQLVEAWIGETCR